MHPTRSKPFQFTEEGAADLQSIMKRKTLAQGELLLDSPEGREFIASAEPLGRNTFKGAAGHLYRIDQRGDTAVITRDDELTEEAQLVMQAQANGSQKIASGPVTIGSLILGTKVIFRPKNTEYKIAGSLDPTQVCLLDDLGRTVKVSAATPIDVTRDDLMTEWSIV